MENVKNKTRYQNPSNLNVATEHRHVRRWVKDAQHLQYKNKGPWAWA